mgnify:CR=1 FL=1
MMGHVGNDVVDLCDPHIAGHFERSRFVARVCGAEEVARVAASDDPHRLLWSLFAAKEAGYKVVAKMTPGIAFSPRRFIVNAASTRVTHDQVELWLYVTHGQEWVHAIAGHGEGEPVWAVERRDAATGESVAARDLAVRLAAGRLGLAPATLSVDRETDRRFRDDLAPPGMLHDGQRLAVDVSLSHDGPWVACALL